MAIDFRLRAPKRIFRSENGHKMSDKEVRNLKSDLQVPQFSENTARGQRAINRDKSKGRGEEREPDMEN